MMKSSNMMLYKKISVPESYRIFTPSLASALSNSSKTSNSDIFSLPSVVNKSKMTKLQGKMETWLTEEE